MRRTKFPVALLAVLCLLAASACQTAAPTPAGHTKTDPELREKYPFYEYGEAGASSAWAPFHIRVALSDAVCFATVTSDMQTVELQIPGGPIIPADDPAFTEKHPDSAISSIPMAVYSIHIDDLIAGKAGSTDLWVYDRADFVDRYYHPKTGDKLFFLLHDLKNGEAEQLHQTEGFTDKPVLAGMPVFYIADGDVMLSIQRLDDMISWDMTAKDNFWKSMKEIWDKEHRKYRDEVEKA